MRELKARLLPEALPSGRGCTERFPTSIGDTGTDTGFSPAFSGKSVVMQLHSNVAANC